MNLRAAAIIRILHATCISVRPVSIFFFNGDIANYESTAHDLKFWYTIISLLIKFMQVSGWKRNKMNPGRNEMFSDFCFLFPKTSNIYGMILQAFKNINLL